MKHIFLICGRMRSGKNQIADFLSDELKSRGMATSFDMFAKNLKENCEQDFGSLGNVLNAKAEELYSLVNVFFSHHLNDHHVYVNEINRVIDTFRIKHDSWYEHKTDITRNLLATYGNDIFRNRVSPFYWANQVKERCETSESDAILITDCRYPSEIEVFDSFRDPTINNFYSPDEDVKVVVIKMERSGILMSTHESETSLEDWTSYDYIVENNGTLKDLKASAVGIVEDLLTSQS